MRSTLSAFNEVWQRQFRKCLISQLTHVKPTQNIILGCSGGMDSMLLLYLLAELCSQFCPQQLQVISVDHQLQQDSQAWSQLVFAQCEKLNIPCQITPVTVEQGNLEAQARNARYQAFLKVLKPDDILVLAHHQQDQAETVILRLLQGAGVQGLSAMQPFEYRQTQQFYLWRPLLDISKSQIQNWVKQLNIAYIDDPMNHDTDYDRVWCRQQLWSVLEQRFPKMQDAIARSALLMQDAHNILTEVLEKDIADCIESDIDKLDLLKYRNLSQPRQRQLLSFWLQGDAQYRPPLAMVQRLQDEVITAREDAQSILHYADHYFMRFDGYLYRYQHIAWQKLQLLPQIQGISFDLNKTYAVACGMIQIANRKIGIDHALLSQQMQLVPRQGGEKIAFYGREVHRVLKKELQTAKIAPWLRHQTQILMYHNDVLGVFTAHGFWLAASPYSVAEGWQPNLLRQ